jgi:hypothetical protein
MKIEISKIFPNKENPRVIKDYKFKKLVSSIKEFPEMLEKRPIVVDEKMVVLGGNMRLKACIEAGLKKIEVIIAQGWTEKQKQEFIIKDNVGYGEWDWDILANEWDIDDLNNWDLELPPIFDEEEDYYTAKIESPEYNPTNKKPSVQELYDANKYKTLITNIEQSNISNTDKQFLKEAAKRHIVFNYSKIADYYANSDKEVQKLMEDSALVIIDFDKAIDTGYVELTKKIAAAYEKNGIL